MESDTEASILTQRELDKAERLKLIPSRHVRHGTWGKAEYLIFADRMSDEGFYRAEKLFRVMGEGKK